MSPTVEIGVVPELSDEQAIKLLEIAFAANFYERDDGKLPTDPVRRQEDAQEMVRQCRLSARAGNKSSAVNDILFIAEVDVSNDGGSKNTQISSEGGPTAAMSATEQQEDLSQYTVPMLGNILKALGNHLEAASNQDQLDEINHNIDVVKDEILSRANGGDQTASQLAQSFSEVEAPAPAAEAASAAAPAEPAADRTALENQITFPMLRANSVDPSEIPGMSDAELQWLIDHPNGAATETSQPAASRPESDSATQMPPARGDSVETTRMVAVPQEPLPPDTPGASGAPAPAPAGTSDERIALEEQVTGPMLKAFGRGRNEVADGTIGDNELRFMIEHPDAKVTMEELEAARALDRGAEEAPQDEPDVQPTIAEQMAAKQEAPQAAVEGDGFTPEPAAEPEKPKRRGRPPKAAEPVPEPVASAAEAPDAPVSATPAPVIPENPIQDHLDRENFPVPAEIEERVHLPFDLSKCSEVEIRSFHSKFHALHSRAGYLLGLWEQELKDEVKLRKSREIAVVNSLPATPKLTDAQRDAKAASDPEVIAHRDVEHELDKKVRQFRFMFENFGRDVAVCSRQLGRSDEEASGAK